MSIHRTLLTASLLLGCWIAVAVSSNAQTLGGNYGTPSRITQQTTNVLNFYGSRNALNTLNRIPRPPAVNRVASLPQQPKPFSARTYERPTISPYLNLYREDVGNAAPNYYAFVRPQIQQQRFAQNQQNALRNMTRQLQAASTHASSMYSRNAGIPSTGHSTRFMNHGGYYSFAR